MAKYTEAKALSNARYDDKTYKSYLFKLRLEEDAEIIKAIQEAQEQGINKREWLHELFYNGNKQEGNKGHVEIRVYTDNDECGDYNTIEF